MPESSVKLAESLGSILDSAWWLVIDRSKTLHWRFVNLVAERCRLSGGRLVFHSAVSDWS